MRQEAPPEGWTLSDSSAGHATGTLRMVWSANCIGEEVPEIPVPVLPSIRASVSGGTHR